MATGMSRHIKALRAMAGTVDAGWFADSVYPGGLPVAQVMMENEFGTDKIPARPILRYSADLSTEIVKVISSSFVPRMLEGSDDPADLLVAIGEGVVSIIKDQFDSGSFVKNAPFTISKKGFDKPLTEYGLARSEVKFKVTR